MKNLNKFLVIAFILFVMAVPCKAIVCKDTVSLDDFLYVLVERDDYKNRLDEMQTLDDDIILREFPEYIESFMRYKNAIESGDEKAIKYATENLNENRAILLESLKERDYMLHGEKWNGEVNNN